MKGQTLVEVLVALSSAVIIITAITILVISSLNNAEYGKNQNLATQYAQEGMEIIRKIRDSDPQTFYGIADGQYCLDRNSTTLQAKIASGNQVRLSGCPHGATDPKENVDGIFSREVILEANVGDCNTAVPTPTPTPPPAQGNIKVTVLVSWTDGKCTTGILCHQSKLISCFSKFNILPTL